MSALYESVDHGPVTRADIVNAYRTLANLVEGLTHVSSGLLADACHDQHGRLQLILCGLERIEDEAFRILPKEQHVEGDVI